MTQHEGKQLSEERLLEHKLWNDGCIDAYKADKEHVPEYLNDIRELLQHISWQSAKLTSAEARCKVLEKFIDHKSYCHYVGNPQAPCTCGLEQSLSQEKKP